MFGLVMRRFSNPVPAFASRGTQTPRVPTGNHRRCTYILAVPAEEIERVAAQAQKPYRRAVSLPRASRIKSTPEDTEVTKPVLKKKSLRSRGRVRATLLSALRQEKQTYSSSASRAHSSTVIASYNVHKCVGMDQRFDPERVAAVIGELGADVVALQEAAQRFGERTSLLDFARIERENGLVAVPLTNNSNAEGWHGNLLLFREGIVREVHPLRLPGIEPRGALVVDVDLDVGPLRIIAAQLGLLRRSRARQAHAILTSVCARSERPTLLLGDLNEWRLGNKSSLHNFDPHFGPLTADLPTFPSRFPLFALDRILGNPQSLISDIEVHRTPLARIASDHLPIKARIDVKGAAAQLSNMVGREAA